MSRRDHKRPFTLLRGSAADVEPFCETTGEDKILYVWVEPTDGHAKKHKVPALVRCGSNGCFLRTAWWFGRVLSFLPADNRIDLPAPCIPLFHNAVETGEGECWHIRATTQLMPIDNWLDAARL